jgi:hypothetical protein
VAVGFNLYLVLLRMGLGLWLGIMLLKMQHLVFGAYAADGVGNEPPDGWAKLVFTA